MCQNVADPTPTPPHLGLNNAFFLHFLLIFWGLASGFVSWVLGIVSWVLGLVCWVLGLVFWV